MSHVRTLLACVVAFVLIHPLQSSEPPVPPKEATPFKFPEGKHGKGELKYINGVPVLTVEGTPEEIGEQVGKLAIKHARPLEAYVKNFVKHHNAGALWPLVVRSCEAMFKHMPEDHRKELEAMVKASGIDRETLVVGNTILDILKLGGCSTMVVEPGRSGTGKLLFGRNFDFPSLGLLHDYSLVTVYRPKGKRAFVSISFPGTIGPPSAMNDAGLCLAADEILTSADKAPRFDPDGVPMASLFRRLMEECSTVEEVEKLAQSVKRTTLGAVTICDTKVGVVMEVTTRNVVVRRADKGVVCCTNHFCTKELATDTYCWRYDLLEKSKQRDKFALEDLKKLLHSVKQDDFTLQTMVFEPAELKLHLALGKPPSSAYPLKELDLKTLLIPDKR